MLITHFIALLLLVLAPWCGSNWSDLENVIFIKKTNFSYFDGLIESKIIRGTCVVCIQHEKKLYSNG
jgi:hypothetical protein